MESHFNGLTPAEDERLTVLAEECAEVIQIICKIQRHGFESYHPADPNTQTNRHLLEEEVGHIESAVWRLEDANDLDSGAIAESASSKGISAHRYLHHQ